MNLLAADTVPALSVAKVGVILGVRPHDVGVVPRDEGVITARVRVIEPLGSTTLLHVELHDPRDTVLRVIVPGDLRVTLEEDVGLKVDPKRVHVFDAATGRRVQTQG
jgi:multiple sugar transport system ATP-binding protein